MGIFQALQRILNSLGFHTDLAAFLVVFGLALARIVTAISLTPFLGGKPVNTNIKVGLSVVFAAVLLPGFRAQADAVAGGTSPITFVALLIKEGMIGMTVGFLVQLVFYAMQTAGALVDTQRGMDQPGLLVPQLQSNASALGQFHSQTALVLFLALNGHLIFLRALARSFDQLPLLSFPHFGAGAAGTALEVAHISGGLFVTALQLGAPMVLTIFLVDVSFGAIGKVAPQVRVSAESMPVKSFAGLAVLFFAIGFIAVRFEAVVSRFFWDLYSALAKLT
jgi:type III secretory pathway component EscT